MIKNILFFWLFSTCVYTTLVFRTHFNKITWETWEKEPFRGRKWEFTKEMTFYLGLEGCVGVHVDKQSITKSSSKKTVCLGKGEYLTWLEYRDFEGKDNR